MSRIRAAAILFLSPLAVGCHAYAPSSLTQLQPGDRVRTLVTQEQFDEFDEHLLGGDRLIEGTVVEADPAGVLLEVPVVTVTEGIRVESFSQRLRIPAPGVAEVEIRSLARGRTYSLAGAIGIVLGAIAWDQLRGSRRGDSTPPPVPEEDIAVVIRIPFTVR